MANFPCPNVVTCPPGTDAENAALRNFSAELPDRFTYFGQFQCDTQGANPPYSVCQSVTSQRAADLCAALCLPDNVLANTAQTCSNDCGSYTVPARTFLGLSQQSADQLALAYACASLNTLCIASNASQTCVANCEAGGTQSYTVPAGRLFAATQAIANDQAYALACAAAALQCLGTLVFNTAQSCTVTCPNGGSITYNIAAGLVAGLSQFESNSNAQALACTLAMLACPTIPPLAFNTTQTCSQDCAGVSIGYVVPAGAFAGLTQGDADSAAYTYACLVLAGSCQTGQPPQQINAGNSEQSCSVACSGGGTFTATIAPGTFRGVNQAIANAAAASEACARANHRTLCLDAIDTEVCAGNVYASFVSTAGPGSGAIFAVTSGTLPPGIDFSAGVLAGIPSFPGVYNFTVTGQDAQGNQSVRSYTITVGGILTNALADGTLNTVYAAPLSVAGFSNPFFTVAGGALPDGLTINPSTGTISGTPTSAGTFDFVIEVSEGA